MQYMVSTSASKLSHSINLHVKILEYSTNIALRYECSREGLFVYMCLMINYLIQY